VVNIWPDEAQASCKGCESARQLTGRRLAASRTRHYGALTNRWFADRKSRPRIGQGMAAQGKRQEKLWEPRLRDLVTNPQERMGLPAAPTTGGLPETGSLDLYGVTLRAAPVSTENCCPEGSHASKMIRPPWAYSCCPWQWPCFQDRRSKAHICWQGG
jgi:hypothetical protein